MLVYRCHHNRFVKMYSFILNKQEYVILLNIYSFLTVAANVPVAGHPGNANTLNFNYLTKF